MAIVYENQHRYADAKAAAERATAIAERLGMADRQVFRRNLDRIRTKVR